MSTTLPVERYRSLTVAPGTAAALASRSTDGLTIDWFGSGQHRRRAAADTHLELQKAELGRAQELLYANGKCALLVVLQAMDAAGKDGTIKHVMSGVNPQGCAVTSFRQPSHDELAHDFLWRCQRALPAFGNIGIFNRSYYEDVLVSRVHPQLLNLAHPAPAAQIPDALWPQRFESINAFEHHLTRNGTQVVKVFLHVSQDVQRSRLLERLDNPEKQWKFSPSDLAETAHFEHYLTAYEDMLTATSTDWAPWYVVPADHKPTMRALTAHLIVTAIDRLDLHPPTLTAEQHDALIQARRSLIQHKPGGAN